MPNPPLVICRAFLLLSLLALAVDDTGHIYVVDALNHRVQKFVIGK